MQRKGKPPGPLSHVRTGAGRHYRLRQLEAAASASLGEDYSAKWSPDGSILLTPCSGLLANVVAAPDWDTETLRSLWRMRSLGLSRRESRYLLTDLPGDVSWDQVTDLMEALAEPKGFGCTIPIRGSGFVRVAAVPLAERVRHLFDCRARDLEAPHILQRDARTQYLNIAIDATSRWVGGRTHNHCTLGFTSQCSTLATWWLAAGSEKWANVFAIAQDLDLDRQLRSLQDVRIRVEGVEMDVLPFLCADSKAHVIMAGGAAFTKGGPFASVCWVCARSRASILALFGTITAMDTPISGTIPVTGILRPIPPERRIPDFGLHGVCRVLFSGVEGILAAMQAQGVAKGTAARGLQSILDRSRIATRTATKNSLSGSTTNVKGHVRMEAAAAVHFVRNASYTLLLDWARDYGRMGGVMCGTAPWLDVCREWWVAFAGSADYVWRSTPFSGADLRSLRTFATDMGHAHVKLGFGVHLWPHLWVDHVWAYAARWRMLARFSCFAMEGSHRRLKRMLRNSGGVSILRDRLGLQNVVDNSTIDDSLLREGWDVGARGLTRQKGYVRHNSYFRARVRSVRVGRLSVWEFLKSKKCLREKGRKP